MFVWFRRKGSRFYFLVRLGMGLDDIKNFYEFFFCLFVLAGMIDKS